MNIEDFATLMTEHYEAADRRFDQIDHQLSEMDSEMRLVKSALAELEEQMDGLSCHAKEIVGLSERISQIEIHLGIGVKIAA